MNIKWILNNQANRIKRRFFPYLWRKHVYKKTLGKSLNLKNPRDLNEKIQWLMSYGDTSQWPLLADKYLVRQWVADKIGGEYLVPLLGKWDRAEDIDLASLPDKFVLKPNNGSYDCIVCHDKSSLDFNEVRQKMAYAIKHSHSVSYGEQHYKRIKPCIIAEQMLEPTSAEGLVDYKIWCFNGKPYCFLVCMNRDNDTHHGDLMIYDLDWVRRPDMMSERVKHNSMCPKPENLNKMLEIAARLSKGIPQVRVDLYNVDGKIYFGEMTMTASYGAMVNFSQSTLDEMGDLCKLPSLDIRSRFSALFRNWLPSI